MTKTTLSIEQAHGKIWLCQRGIYGEDSVLSGQDFRQLHQAYDTIEEAVKANPGVPVDLDGYQPETYIPINPPKWFDPADAGERWSEDY